MVKRAIESNILKRLNDEKVIIIYGARQVGKTTLLKKIFENIEDVLWLNGDENYTHLLLEDANRDRFKTLIGNNKFLVIDEAQRIENIGLKLKIIHDTIKDVKVVVSGSSSFVLANSINEPLTGRKWEFQLHPFSFEELVSNTNLLKEITSLERRLLFGSYPEVVTKSEDAKALLIQLSSSYLYKDVLEFEKLLKSNKLSNLLTALAFQIGSEVSLSELSRLIGLDVKTVDKYLAILEKSFVIFSIPSFSRNLRNEIKKGKKYYFCDIGIRNALINQFAPLTSRNDVGQLWKNYLMSERQRYLSNNNIYCSSYFWRTHSQQEIDYIEERDGVLSTYEFKFGSNKSVKRNKLFETTYPNSTFTVVNKDNYEKFLTALI
ncbi:MAG: ATP-binding protein [Sphaerochaetaceae bacterium]